MVYKRAQLSCNMNDPFQAEIYNHVSKQSNTSSYLKMLVYHDMKGQPKQEVEEVLDGDPQSFI